MSGRELVLSHTSEVHWQNHVLDLAALGGWHGAHIRLSHGTLEGLHSRGRAFPRGADHDDASGIPDLFLVHPGRGILLMPELKTVRGKVSPDQTRWLWWLDQVRTVAAPLWRPTDEVEVGSTLLEGRL